MIPASSPYGGPAEAAGQVAAEPLAITVTTLFSTARLAVKAKPAARAEQADPVGPGVGYSGAEGAAELVGLAPRAAQVETDGMAATLSSRVIVVGTAGTAATVEREAPAASAEPPERPEFYS